MMTKIIVHKPEGENWLEAALEGPSPSVDFDVQNERVSSVQVFTRLNEVHIWLAPVTPSHRLQAPEKSV